MSSRYEIREQIGKGGLGAVYKAFDTQLQREVAIKRVLTAGQATEEEVQEAADKLIAEAQTLSSLNHPNIITVFDVGQDEQGGFVVMELLKGETLDETIERGVLTQDDFAEVVYQTMEALISAQANDVIHRDIKPTNIMVIWQASGKFQTKILDFGLAKFSKTPSVQTMDQEESVLGSIFFMAPEQFERGELDARTDLYQMGCVYYNALTGQYPFNGETAPQVMNAHLQHKVVPLDQIRPDLSPSICQWVMWLINRDIEHRPVDARDALKRWPRNPEPPGAIPVQALPVEETPDVVTGQIKIITTASQASAPPSLIVGTSPNAPAGAGTGAITRPHIHHHKEPASKKTKLIVIGSIAGLVMVLAGIGIANSMAAKKAAARINEIAAADQVTASGKDVDMAVKILSNPDNPLTLRNQAMIALGKMDGPGIDAAIYEDLKEAKSNTLRVSLSSVLADKEYDEALSTIFSYVPAANNGEQQLQFVSAIRALADRDDLDAVLDLLKVNPDADFRRSVERTALDILRHGGQQDKAVADILTRVSTAETDERKSLFRILGTLGTDDVKTRLASIFNQKKDLEYQRDAISAYLTWGDRSAIEDVESIIDNADDNTLKTIAGVALARLVTLPGPETLDEKIEVWDRTIRKIEAQSDVRSVIGFLFEYPHPKTLALLKKWAKDDQLKGLAQSNVKTMEQFIDKLKVLGPEDALAGNRGRFLGDRGGAAYNRNLGSISQWVSPNTGFSWSFKMKEAGDYLVEVSQGYEDSEPSDFVIYLAGQTKKGKTTNTGSFETFKPVRLKGPIKFEADSIYTLVLVAGENVQPRMMDIEEIRFIK